MNLNVEDLRNKNKTDLQKLLKKTRKNLRETVVDILHGKSKNTSVPKFLRKDIARIFTVLNEEKNVKNLGKSKDKKVKYD